MSLLTKWKNALVNRLNVSRGKDRHHNKEGLLSKQEIAAENPGPGRPDSKKEFPSPEGSPPNASGDKRSKIFSRSSVTLTGVYLVLTVLLLSLAVLRWGKLPVLEIPGVRREISDLSPGGDGIGEIGEIRIRAEDEGETPASAADLPLENGGKGAGPPSLAEGWPAPATGSAEERGDEEEMLPELPEEDISAVQARETYLPQAASPLPEWSLHTPFNAYNSDLLPSGGVLHSFSRGVYFRATPGAPVSAIWDGYVLKTGGENSPFSNSVLIKHDGGFTSYYGNLREVWVEEGKYINRGENIGLMPHNLPRETLAVSTSNIYRAGNAGLNCGTNAAQENAECAEGEKCAEREPRQVPVRTIFGGYRGGDIVETWGGELIYDGGEQPETPGNRASTPLFDETSPLLYLEVRFSNNSFLDPLEFIPARN